MCLSQGADVDADVQVDDDDADDYDADVEDADAELMQHLVQLIQSGVLGRPVTESRKERLEQCKEQYNEDDLTQLQRCRR